MPTPSRARSWLHNTVLLGMYGRGWGIAPILGRLGMFDSVGDMARDVDRYEARMRPWVGGKRIVPEIHLIYAMATPCGGGGDCLSYLDDTGQDIVHDYILPAQRRGWLVFLDTQLGRSDPVTQVKRMIAKGYLKYDNVEVAIDPEFHVVEPGQTRPGIPIGTVEASQVNAVQKLLDDYVRREHLPHRKVVIVHQFGDANVNDGAPFMIQHKKSVRTYPNVDLVIVADGFGPPYSKVFKYDRMTDPKVYPRIRYRGIKLFPPGPYILPDHTDQPMLTMKQVFGFAVVPGGIRVQHPPDVVIIT